MRYTVIIIDHHDFDKARIIKTDDLDSTFWNKEETKVVTQNRSRVYPDYEAVKDMLSDGKQQKRGSLSKRMVKPSNGETQTRKRRTPQEIFEEKLANEDFDSFNANDLVCFFRHCAAKKGIRYVANWKRDNAHMKKLQEEFTNREIIAMIEFLFYSKQDYLEKKKLSIGIFMTGWLNTIYQDSQDWLEDKYVPRKKNQKPREWTEDKPEEGTNVTIGWGDDL